MKWQRGQVVTEVKLLSEWPSGKETSVQSGRVASVDPSHVVGVVKRSSGRGGQSVQDVKWQRGHSLLLQFTGFGFSFNFILVSMKTKVQVVCHQRTVFVLWPFT